MSSSARAPGLGCISGKRPIGSERVPGKRAGGDTGPYLPPPPHLWYDGEKPRKEAGAMLTLLHARNKRHKLQKMIKLEYK